MSESPHDRDRAPDEFTVAQRAGLDARQTDQDRTLNAIHELEAALSSAAAGREPSWRSDVAGALAILDSPGRFARQPGSRHAAGGPRGSGWRPDLDRARKLDRGAARFVHA